MPPRRPQYILLNGFLEFGILRVLCKHIKRYGDRVDNDRKLYTLAVKSSIRALISTVGASIEATSEQLGVMLFVSHHPSSHPRTIRQTPPCRIDADDHQLSARLASGQLGIMLCS